MVHDDNFGIKPYFTEGLQKKGLGEPPFTNRGFKPRIPDILGVGNQDSSRNRPLRPIYKSEDISIYEVSVAEAQGPREIRAVENDVGIHFETPIARVPDESPVDLYKSLLNLNHDLAVGKISLNPLVPPSEATTLSKITQKQDGIYYGAHVIKRHVRNETLRAEFDAFRESCAEVSRQVQKIAAEYHVDTIEVGQYGGHNRSVTKGWDKHS